MFYRDGRGPIKPLFTAPPGGALKKNSQSLWEKKSQSLVDQGKILVSNWKIYGDFFFAFDNAKISHGNVILPL